MAVASPVPAITPPASPMNFPEFRLPENVAVTREIVERPVSQVIEEKIHVAVGKNFKEFKSLLMWAFQHSGGKRICIIHVHQPAQMIPLLGTKFHASSLKEQEVRAYRGIERMEMLKMLDEYVIFCRRWGVRPERYHIERESIEEGILELISLHGIRKLVMGAAADKRYSRGMTDIKSKKSISIRLQAPAFCQIWFICKQHLIHTKEVVSDASREPGSSSLQANPISETGQSNHMRSYSVTLGQNNPGEYDPGQTLFRRVKSVTFSLEGAKASSTTSPDINRLHLSAQSHSDSEVASSASSDEGDLLSRSTSRGSHLSTCSSPGMANGSFLPLVRNEGSEVETELSILPEPAKKLCHPSPPSVLDGRMEDPLYDQLEQAMAEATHSRRAAYEEALRRSKAERDAIEAIRKVKASEALYAEESRQRKEIEKVLAEEKAKLVKMKNEADEVMEELRDAMNQKSLLESKVAESDLMVKELEQKIVSAVDLLQNYKKEKDELQMERDNALKEAEELRRSQAESSSSHMPQFNSFCFSEIEEATHNFDPSCKIGEGGYGSIYKGVLHHTQVAIKVLHSHSLQGPTEYQQEVNVLTKLRHPNLVTLIGACPDAWTLVYEYLSNGSLEDRLCCQDNSPPLSWQARIRIAAELCSVLIFLHSSKPHSIVHGDLKPANVLLDANLVSKLSDFGICRLLSQNEGSSNNTTLCCRTDPKGTFAYMDPEFLASGELTPKSDVYSFGIILLRLLTGRPALGITKEVQYALDKGNLKSLLDPLAGDWPFVQAEQLARLALRCSEMSRRSRPDLESEVWRVLEPMKASCGGSSYFRLGSLDHCEPPPYFICPIFQEVMQDPHVAADGFTYEALAFMGWLDSGHDTSPMTNAKLAHNDLIPNRALRSAIQEWLQDQ